MQVIISTQYWHIVQYDMILSIMQQKCVIIVMRNFWYRADVGPLLGNLINYAEIEPWSADIANNCRQLFKNWIQIININPILAHCIIYNNIIWFYQLCKQNLLWLLSVISDILPISGRCTEILTIMPRLNATGRHREKLSTIIWKLNADYYYQPNIGPLYNMHVIIFILTVPILNQSTYQYIWYVCIYAVYVKD